jgi:hypothetical protein
MSTNTPKVQFVSLALLSAGIQTVETLVDAHRRRGKAYKIIATMRLDMDYREGDSKDENNSVQFQLQYHVRAGSSYVQVCWRPRHILKSSGTREFFPDTQEWTEIGDHDSCWRDCDGAIKRWVRKYLESTKEWCDKFEYYVCEGIHIEEIK